MAFRISSLPTDAPNEISPPPPIVRGAYALTGLMAGFGAGYSSGSSLGGALSGAMAGFGAMPNPAGLIIGCVCGVSGSGIEAMELPE